MNEKYEEFLDHYKNPRNFRELEVFTCKGRSANYSCGDIVDLYILIDKATGKVLDISFSGEGCSVTIASTSILTEYLKDKTIQEIRNLTEDEFFKILAIPITTGRIKCALVGFNALIKCIQMIEQQQNVN